MAVIHAGTHLIKQQASSSKTWRWSSFGRVSTPMLPSLFGRTPGERSRHLVRQVRNRYCVNTTTALVTLPCSMEATLTALVVSLATLPFQLRQVSCITGPFRMFEPSFLQLSYSIQFLPITYQYVSFLRHSRSCGDTVRSRMKIPPFSQLSIQTNLCSV